MGSYSHLRIGYLNVDWNKNSLSYHSELFSSQDKKDVEYHYADNIVESKPGYSRPLRRLRTKVQLLGFTEQNVKKKVEVYLEKYDQTRVSFTFETLLDLAKCIDISKSIYDEMNDIPEYSEFSMKIVNVIRDREEFKPLREFNAEVMNLIDTLEPYEILLVFLLNEQFLDNDVVWEYYDLVEGGWLTEKEVFLDIQPSPVCLLITEGSSDSLILKQAFDWIYPDLAGFFEFIDMDKNYPFTGVGNLVNFFHGICKIGSQRNIVFIFDNDTAGNAAIAKCISPPKNIVLLTLPRFPSFETFITVGPNGENIENINGRAVAIEHFLDLEFQMSSKPRVRWTSYDEKMCHYQGVLENKESYSKKFFKAKKIIDANYDLNKLRFLLDHIIGMVSENNAIDPNNSIKLFRSKND